MSYRPRTFSRAVSNSSAFNEPLVEASSTTSRSRLGFIPNAAIASNTLDFALVGLSGVGEHGSLALIADSQDWCLEGSGRGWLKSMLSGRGDAVSSFSSSVKIELLLPRFSRYGL